MNSNKFFIENREAISAVIGVILMVAITVAIAATTFIYFTGMLGPPDKEAENAAISVLTAKASVIMSIPRWTRALLFSRANWSATLPPHCPQPITSNFTSHLTTG